MDQLHGVVAQISSFCFETKKLCVTTEFIVLTLVVKFTTDALDHSIFVSALVVTICFWFLDATAYFYQVKLRGTMESIRERLASRESVVLVSTQGTRFIAPDRAKSSWAKRVRQSAFNHSMWLYAVLMIADAAVWLAYAAGAIE